MLLDELDNHQQRNCIVAAVAAHASSHTCEQIIFGHKGNRMDAHYEVIVVKLKENMPNLFTQMYRLSPSSFDKLLSIFEPSFQPRRKTGKKLSRQQ
jgi:hypothetical protein